MERLYNCEINVAFKANNLLGGFKKNNKSVVDKNKKSGFYNSNAGRCSQIYMRRNFRNFDIMCSKH